MFSRFPSLSFSASAVVNLPQFCVAMHLIRYSMKGTPMPQVLPNKLALLLKSASEAATPKKKKKKKKVPKGFEKHDDNGLYFNSANKWYFNIVEKVYFKETTGPFFVFDTNKKKLVPK